MALHFTFLALVLTACTPVEEDAPEQLVASDVARSALDGTPDGIGLVAFLNHKATTTPVLDDTVGLDARAAKNLIAHRDGADKKYGTRDDDRFDGVDEVDAVSYVGPAAMSAMFAYVAANGWVPADGDVLGTWDGVTFTVDEADATLALANTATAAELDGEIGLDQRAVNSIVAARPIPSVLALSELYYVGKSALTDLKAAAAPPIVCTEPGAHLRGQTFALLPDAVAAAQAGDVITLCDGGYGDPIVVDKNLTIRSVNGAEVTALDVTSMGASAIEVRGASLVLEGLTVTYGEGTTDATGARLGAGLYIDSSKDVSVKGCIFQENYATDGGAIWHRGPGRLTLTDTAVRYNHAARNGGGLWTSGPVTVNGGRFEMNEAASGGAIYVAAGGSVTTNGVSYGDNTPNDIQR